MLFSRFVVCACMVFLSAVPAWASADIGQWKTQLQKDMDVLEKSASSIQTSGTLSVMESQGEWQALLPRLVVQGQGQGERWVLDGVRLIARPQGNAVTVPVRVQFPTEIIRQNINGKEVARVAIGSQNMSGTWNVQKGGFETLSGGLNTVTFRSTDGRDTTTIEQLAVQDVSPTAMTVSLSGMHAAWVGENGPARSSIAAVKAVYGFHDAHHFTLARLLGLISPAVFMNDQSKMDMHVVMNDIAINEAETATLTSTSTIGRLEAKAQIVKSDKGDTVLTRQQVDVTDITRSPDTITSVFLPTKMSVNGTINALPMGFLNVLGGENMTALRDSMMAKGTRLDLNEITAQLQGKTSAKGHGWLKADNATPMGYVGRLNLTISELQALSTQLQREMLTGDNASVKAKTGAFMVVMAITGFAKQNGTNHDMVIDLTPDGQILVNGQDISRLMGQKSIATAP